MKIARIIRNAKETLQNIFMQMRLFTSCSRATPVTALWWPLVKVVRWFWQLLEINIKSVINAVYLKNPTF